MPFKLPLFFISLYWPLYDNVAKPRAAAQQFSAARLRHVWLYGPVTDVSLVNGTQQEAQKRGKAALARTIPPPAQ
jgi:hypothetical protein